jgi:hypothetical protein
LNLNENLLSFCGKQPVCTGLTIVWYYHVIVFTLDLDFSYDDEINNTMTSNMAILFIGSCLIFIYIAVVLGRFNSVQQRVSGNVSLF